MRLVWSLYAISGSACRDLAIRESVGTFYRDNRLDGLMGEHSELEAVLFGGVGLEFGKVHYSTLQATYASVSKSYGTVC